MKPLPLDSAAEEQASLWAARLEGSTLSAEDRAALDAWLAESSAHRALLSQYCQFSADLEQTLPALVEAGVVAMPAAQPERRARWNAFNWFFGGALAAAAAAAIVWIAWPTARIESIATPVAQRQSITLADGTQVQLNARTSLQVEMSRHERRVRLADGQAFFVVSKDPARPFIVETPAGAVRVTGTVFDVRSEATSQLEVTVVEGSVQVRPNIDNGTPHALGARDRLVADAKRVTVTKEMPAAELDKLLAWREGKIYFEGATVREAAERFARYHGRGIAVATTVDATGHTVGARYDIDDFDGFLNSLTSTWPDLVVTRELNGTVRITVRGQP